MKQSLISLISGLFFGLGLSISGLVNPQKILDFLNITGPWDPSLLLTMAAAITITMITSSVFKKRSKPLLNSQFHLPEKTQIDKRLIIGALLFGVGWGLVGLCPGPAIAAISYYTHEIGIFLLSMLAGMLVVKFINRTC